MPPAVFCIRFARQDVPAPDAITDAVSQQIQPRFDIILVKTRLEHSIDLSACINDYTRWKHPARFWLACWLVNIKTSSFIIWTGSLSTEISVLWTDYRLGRGGCRRAVFRITLRFCRWHREMENKSTDKMGFCHIITYRGAETRINTKYLTIDSHSDLFYLFVRLIGQRILQNSPVLCSKRSSDSYKGNRRICRTPKIRKIPNLPDHNGKMGMRSTPALVG